MAKTSNGNHGSSNGVGGPFTGEEVGEALRLLGWELLEEPADDEYATYVNEDVDNLVTFDRTVRRIYYGDVLFRSITGMMVSSQLNGLTRIRAVRQARSQLQAALLRLRGASPNGRGSRDG